MPLIQIGSARWIDADQAAKRGLAPYKAVAAAARNRVATRPAAAAAASTKNAAPNTKVRTPITSKSATSPARNVPRDIREAMSLGIPNNVINALIAAGALQRPKSFLQASDWSTGAWAEAARRGLVW